MRIANKYFRNIHRFFVVCLLSGAALLTDKNFVLAYNLHISLDAPALLDEYPSASSYVDSLDCKEGIARITIHSKTESAYKFDAHDYFLKSFDEFLSENTNECPVSRVYIRKKLFDNVIDDYFAREDAHKYWIHDESNKRPSAIRRIDSTEDLLDYFYMRKSPLASFARYADKEVKKYFTSKSELNSNDLIYLYDTFGEVSLEKISFGDRIRSPDDYHISASLCEAGAIIHCLAFQSNVAYNLIEAADRGGLPPTYILDLVNTLKFLESHSVFKARVLMSKIQNSKRASDYFNTIASESYKKHKIPPPNNFRVTEAINNFYSLRCIAGAHSQHANTEPHEICAIGINGYKTSISLALVEDLTCKEKPDNEYVCRFRTRAMMQAQAPSTSSILLNDLMNSITINRSPWRYAEGVLTPISGGWKFEPTR